jgi:hypothetical protein
MSQGNACSSLYWFTWNLCFLDNFLYRDPELPFINTVRRFNLLILGHGRRDERTWSPYKAFFFLFKKERLKRTQAETCWSRSQTFLTDTMFCQARLHSADIIRNCITCKCSYFHAKYEQNASAALEKEHQNKKTRRCMLMAGQTVHIRPKPRPG